MDTENMLPHSMNGLTGMNGLSGTIPPSTPNAPNGQQQAKPAEPVPSSMSDQETDADFPEMNEDELKFAVIHELKVRIQAWVDDPSGNSRNLSAFARKAQVTDSTIRRIMSPGGGSIPTQDNLMRILVALTGFQNTREVVEYFKNRTSPIFTHLKMNTYFCSNPISQSVSYVMEGVSSPTIPFDDDVYLAFSLIDPVRGTSYFDLIKFMGESANSALDRLVLSGLVELNSEGNFVLTNGISVLTRDTALNIARVLVSRFTRSDAERSQIALTIDRVSDEGLNLLTNLRTSYVREFNKIIDTQKGNNPIFMFDVLDSMEFKKPSKQRGSK